MRKMVLTAAAALTALLTACGAQAGNETPTIRPSAFSQETQEVLDIIDDEIAFFDYSVPETIRSSSIDLWVCGGDGEWKNAGKSYGNIDPGGARIAVRVREDVCDLFNIVESGHTKASLKTEVDFKETDAVSQTRLSNPEEIEAGKEIPLWIKLGVATGMPANLSNDFRRTKCEAGLAVTVTFFDTPAE